MPAASADYPNPWRTGATAAAIRSTNDSICAGCRILSGTQASAISVGGQVLSSMGMRSNSGGENILPIADAGA
jgi:hypothetical protein